MFNGYVDLGTWYGFTPFLGAGVGFSRNTITNFGDVNIAVLGDAHSSDASKWNFAWALHAGVGYRVSNAMTLELAYRYIDLGKAMTGPMVDYTFASIDTPFEFNRLTSQDVKFGLRYNFGAYDYAPPPPLRNKS
jgi:opacity protein-like surface antigen